MEAYDGVRCVVVFLSFDMDYPLVHLLLLIQLL